MKIKIIAIALIIGLASFDWINPNEKEGKDDTLIEMINAAESVSVYMIPGTLSVRRPETLGLLPASCLNEIPDEDLGNSYSSIHSDIVAELNKVFSTDKFKEGDISGVPMKTVTVLGVSGETQDWATLDDELIVTVTISGNYSFFPGDGKVKTTYAVTSNTRFAQITNSQVALKYFTALGVNYAASTEFEIEGCFDTMDKYKEQADPGGLVEELSSKVSGGYDKYYEKRKKKYDKAMKKKK